MKTDKAMIKDTVVILVSALACVFVFWVLFSIVILLDPSNQYYHP